ncbi:MAG TPA: 50S ribosomal protein L11 methyltransferase [Gaiellaceae bacterium]|nr:50S ribosomal protein L11 methyltransferase [Gaiellaceae bacterium]
MPSDFTVERDEPVAEGWEDAWRAFHRGIPVGRLWVGPPWEAPPADLLPVVIEPGRAFGTGAHPTTHLCLELLQEIEAGSLVDIGCGSGVLSIAAAKLGFAPVTATDVDPIAIEVTRANADANGVDVATSLVGELPHADVAVANISLDAVTTILAQLDARRAIVSGYLDQDVLHADRWRIVERRVLDGWAADLLEFRS